MKLSEGKAKSILGVSGSNVHNGQLKSCSKCKKDKATSEFSPRKGRKSKFQSQCKECMNAATKARRDAYPDKVAAEAKRFFEANRESEKLRCKVYRENNKDVIAAQAALRRSKIKNATPPWVTKQHKQDMRAMYTLAKKYKTVFGQDYHVDHIVPLSGKNICGLHVPWNLQLLLASVNHRKSNKHVSAELVRSKS